MIAACILCGFAVVLFLSAVGFLAWALRFRDEDAFAVLIVAAIGCFFLAVGCGVEGVKRVAAAEGMPFTESK